MTDIDHAAERVRNLTATDAAFANFMADSSFDSAEEMLRFIDWFDTPGRVPSGWDLTRYARAKMALSYAAQAAEIAELRAKLEAAEKDRDDLLNTAATLGEQVCRDKPRRDRLATFEDSRPVDEELLRTVFANCGCDRYESEYGVRVHFSKEYDPQFVAEFSLRKRDGNVMVNQLATTVGCVSGMIVTTIGQLNHLLAALKPGGAK